MKKNENAFILLGLLITILRGASVIGFGYLISNTSTSPKFQIMAMMLVVIPIFSSYYQIFMKQGLREKIIEATKRRILEYPEFLIKIVMIFTVTASSVVTLTEVPVLSLGFTLGIVLQRAMPLTDAFPILCLAFLSVSIGSLFGSIAGQAISWK